MPYNNQSNYQLEIMCRNDELSWLFTNRLSATRYMKVKRIRMTEILRRIWLFPANKSSESFSKQPIPIHCQPQLIIAAHNCHKELQISLMVITIIEKGTSWQKACRKARRKKDAN